MFDDPYSHEFFPRVPSMHHEWVGESFNDWTLSLTETLGCITTRWMGQIFRILLLHCNVVLNNTIQHTINFSCHVTVTWTYYYTMNGHDLMGRASVLLLTWSDMSETCTSSQLHLLNNLISGSSAGGGKSATDTELSSPQSSAILSLQQTLFYNSQFSIIAVLEHTLTLMMMMDTQDRITAWTGYLPILMASPQMELFTISLHITSLSTTSHIIRISFVLHL